MLKYVIESIPSNLTVYNYTVNNIFYEIKFLAQTDTKFEIKSHRKLSFLPNFYQGHELEHGRSELYLRKG